jgi:hypothetical protein
MFYEKMSGVHWYIGVETDSKTLLLNKSFARVKKVRYFKCFG